MNDKNKIENENIETVTGGIYDLDRPKCFKCNSLNIMRMMSHKSMGDPTTYSFICRDCGYHWVERDELNKLK